MSTTARTPPHSPAGRWLAFYAVGGLGMLVQLATLWGLVRWAGMDYRIATALGVELSLLHNFVWHERWTWSDRTGGIDGTGALGRLAKFHASNGLVSIWGNVAFTTILVEYAGAGYLVANVIAVASCSLLNFVAADRLVFSIEG